MERIFRFILGVIFFTVCQPAASVNASIVFPRGANWKYDASGTNLGTAWKEINFDDSSWPNGNAVLGYGELYITTVLPSGNSTYYFRTEFDLQEDPASLGALTLLANYDDAIVVYVNGMEVLRRNLPAGTITYNTFAIVPHEGGIYETIDLTAHLNKLVMGINSLAVEVHQINLISSDLVMDMELQTLGTTLNLTRGPYLQRGTPGSIVIRWRTDIPSDSRVQYGNDPASLSFLDDDPTVTTEHEIELSGLSPAVQYYYSVGSVNTVLASGPDYYFVTAPLPGTTMAARIWVLGDAGTANADQAAVRDAYYNFTGAVHTDLWVMLGDNAYNSGTDPEYQAAVFNMYPDMLRKSVLWPAFGNHDGLSASSPTQTGVFYDIFTLPKNAESGGYPSGTEAYYSFDFANIHFICLNSHDLPRSSDGEMLTWLQNDLAANTLKWVVAFWHHPPYSKGSHNSDIEIQLIEMRENALPILENGGADIILTGHSHSYERSFLLDGHYGYSGSLTSTMILDAGDGRLDGDSAYSKPTFGPASHEGTVYVVAGSSGKIYGGPLNHPAMFISLNTLGSVVMDVNDNRMDVTFLDNNGNIPDYFTIIKGNPSVANSKVFLQGPYSSSGMNTYLRDSGGLPLSQPYNISPYNYGGTESVVGIPAGVVDWILLELRSGTSAATKVAERAAFIKNDGSIVDLDGLSPVKFYVAAGDYYLVVRHRNHLAIMSGNPLPINKATNLYDFTTAQSKAFGENPMKELSLNVFGMYSGNANADGIIDESDRNQLWRIQNGTRWLYLKWADFNLDGGIDALDLNWHWRPNNGTATAVPAN